MEVELFDITGLAITQSSELLGIAKDKLNSGSGLDLWK